MPKNILKIIIVLALVYLFLFSIGLMGVAFKGFGKDFAENLIQTTSNPLVGLFIGILATSIVQSSSTTTSIVVGMVGSGVISIANAVPIVMGANIGTTVTNTLVSIGHISRREEFKRAVGAATVHDFFNILCVAVLLPLELLTGFLEKTACKISSLCIGAGGIEFSSPIKAITVPLIDLVKNLLLKINIPHILIYILILAIALTILFFSLFFIVRCMKSIIAKRTEIILNNIIGKHGFLAIIAGLCFTSIVQSSSITTSLLVPLVAAGIISVETVFPVTMGANIGTTTTAILASFATGNTAAVTIAFVHFLFNLTGVTCLYPLKPIRAIPIFLAKNLGELAFRRRRYVIIYVLTLFFAVPTILIVVSKLLK
ncbi:MAG: hypothetical protein GF375_06445 [Candidatus Omnitrophica bacterium]|nr:hypothetical protein [Candidatus Omnitrophota bacterium]MBD3269614.1 hypothetical protein [Candidatus Omnitrophota bacterium]